MKLLFDENLSPALSGRIADLFPNSLHVRDVGMKATDDPVVWNYAKDNDFMIVSKDADMHDLSLVFGNPPKVMKFLLLCCFFTIMCSGVMSQTRQSEDVSLLCSSDVAYADAMEFAQFLDKHNLKVQSIHASNLNGFFRGVEKAAYFKTENGVVEVIFFPDTNGAEKLTIKERREDKRYIYSFEGLPRSGSHGDRLNSNRPVYFITRRNWFIVTYDEKLSNALKSVFAKE